MIVPLLYDYYLGKCEENFYETDSACRYHLLRVLKGIQLNPHPSTPPPTQYSIEIFSMALRDTDSRIVQEAKLANAELEKIAHPSAASLEIPTQTAEEPNEKQLGIHWSRPPAEQQTNEQNDVHVDNSVWDRFREVRNETITVADAQAENTRLQETTEPDNRDEATNGISEVPDGPTPSKQPKLGHIDPSELMDTSEDEITIGSPCKNDTNISNGKFQTTVPESPRKRAAGKSTTDDSRENGDSSRSEYEASYLTLREIQGEQENSTNDNEKSANDSKLLSDNSDEEAMLNLFCDELKDS